MRTQSSTFLSKNYISLIFLLLFIGTGVNAQEKPEYVKMKPENWVFKSGAAEFIAYKSRPALKILNSSDRVILKDLNFVNGTIEYDFQPLDPRFASFYFRWKDAKENECFYFRTEAAGNASAVDAIQYAPHVGGVNLWDLLFHFQANATFTDKDWNHVKLVISGKQMRVYVNDMNKAVLEVPMLEGNTNEGLLAFDGQCIISNLEIKKDEVEKLSPKEGIDPTDNDPRYLRNWEVSEPITTAENIDFDLGHFPKEETTWENITAERRGLINLTRKFGQSEGRRITWLKVNINAVKVQKKLLRLGFSDEVWVFINKQPLYFDKNYYGTPIMKAPDGRCDIENSSFRIPLNKGENELLIGVANNFFGWGIVARFDEITDLKL